MKKYLPTLKGYFTSKKYFILGISALLMGALSLGSNIMSNNKKNKENLFKTLSYDEEATASGQIAGIFDIAQTASPSPILKITYRPYTNETQSPVPTASQIKTSGSSNNTSITNNPNPTTVPTVNTPIQDTPTAGPTATPQATPTPGFSDSINTSVDADTLKVIVDASKPLKACVIHFRKELNGSYVPTPAETSIDGNTCHAEHNKSEIKNVWIYIASTDGSTKEDEKSGPFE